MTQAYDLKKLAEFFPASAIEWRPGAVNFDKTRAQAIPYINARAIQQRLDDVCGPENWKNEFKPSPIDNGLICALSVRDSHGTWVAKEDGGGYEPEGPDSTTPLIAVKGAYTNAFKRASVLWGIGRYLYAVNHAWVEVDADGNFTKTPTLPRSLLPSGDESSSPVPRLAVVPTTKPVSVESTKDVVDVSAVFAVPSDDTANTGTAQEPALAPSVAQVKGADSAAKDKEPVKSDSATSAAPEAPAQAKAKDAAELSTASPAAGLTAEMLDQLDEGNRNYVKQLVGYIESGRNLATVHTALLSGRAKDRLTDFPDVLGALRVMAESAMALKVAA